MRCHIRCFGGSPVVANRDCPMPRLTKRLVESLEPKKKRYLIWDSLVPGFAVRVGRSGKLTYVLKYRLGGGGRAALQRWHTLGTHGAITVDEARSLASTRSAEVVKGGDPGGERQAARKAKTVSDLCERYLTDHAEPHKRPRSIAEDRRLIEKRILPALGASKVRDVAIEDIEQLHRSLRPTPYEANRTLALLSKMFSLAERWRLRPPLSNPCRQVRRFKERARERYLSPAELGQLGEQLSLLEADEEISEAAAAGIRLLLFSGCRVSEIRSLRWDEVDLEAGCLRLKESKTGGKIVYLPAPALEVLSSIPRHAPNPYVLVSGRTEGSLRNLNTPWYRLRERAKLTDVRLHDLRHTFASFGAGAGFSLPVIGKMLGHTQPQTTQRYAHLAEDPVRQAVEHIGGTIAAALKGKAGKVIELGRQGK